MIEKNNFLKRCISAMAIGSIFFVAIFIFRPLFYILFTIIGLLMIVEWYKMTKQSHSSFLIGQTLIPLSILSLMFLSYIDESGWLIASFFATIWSVDTMAMIGGKMIGGPKLAPKLSPKKTISGLLSGATSAVIIINLLSIIPYYSLPIGMKINYIPLSLFVFFIAFIAQASDLFVSYFKRKFNIKDTGTIIPGHGGVLDRFDSIILTSPIIFIIMIIFLN